MPRDGGEAIGIICDSDDFYRFTGTSGCTVEATLEFTHAEHLVTFRLPETIQKGRTVVLARSTVEQAGREVATGLFTYLLLDR